MAALLVTAAVVTGIYATLIAGTYFWIVLSWPNSVGERAGTLQRFSTKKGWICQTHEGELASAIAPGATPAIWTFSVRDASVLPGLVEALGKRVVIHYREHRGLVTSCFGETRYFVPAFASWNSGVAAVRFRDADLARPPGDAAGPPSFNPRVIELATRDRIARHQ